MSINFHAVRVICNKVSNIANKTEDQIISGFPKSLSIFEWLWMESKGGGAVCVCTRGLTRGKKRTFFMCTWKIMGLNWKFKLFSVSDEQPVTNRRCPKKISRDAWSAAVPSPRPSKITETHQGARWKLFFSALRNEKVTVIRPGTVRKIGMRHVNVLPWYQLMEVLHENVLPSMYKFDIGVHLKSPSDSVRALFRFIRKQ